MTGKPRTEIEARVMSLLKTFEKKIEAEASSVPREMSSPDNDGKEASALFMSLLFEPASDNARALTDEIISRMSLPVRGPKQKIIQAVRIVASELMRCAADGDDSYLYRSMGANTFDASTVSYKPFCSAYKALAAQGMLTHEPGAVDFGSGVKRTATRFYPTAALIDLANGFGVKPADFDLHFKPLPRSQQVRQPISLRKATRRAYGAFGLKIAGDPMPVDYSDPTVMRFAKQVNEINEALADTKIDARTNKGIIVPHIGFQRSFNQGDLPGVHYNRGGRLFAIHGGYQSLSAEERAKMTIDGEAVVECDISASHLTIAMSLMKLPINNPSALYHIPGIPRIIVKLYVNASLGNGKPLYRWPDDAVEDYAYVERSGSEKTNRLRAAVEDESYSWSGDLRKDWPIGKMKREVLDRFPFLLDLEKKEIGWGKLQLEESCVIIDTVHDLCCKQGIPVLPVHDSIICKASDRDAVMGTMKRQFFKGFGVKPGLKCK